MRYEDMALLPQQPNRNVFVKISRTGNNLWHLFIVFKPEPGHNLQSKTFYIAIVSQEK